MNLNYPTVGAIDELAHYIANGNKKRGFWPDMTGDDNEDPWTNEQVVAYNSAKIALMHSELSEALETIRDGAPIRPNQAMSEKLEKRYTLLEEELADALIRILDFCGHYNLDIGGAVMAKLKYNESRPYKHGREI